MAYISPLFNALADPTRRGIFESLARSPQSVGGLAAGLPISRPAVSQHLKALKVAGLVIDRPAGAFRVYRVDPDGLGALRAWLDEFWTEALEAFRIEAERGGKDHGPDQP